MYKKLITYSNWIHIINNHLLKIQHKYIVRCNTNDEIKSTKIIYIKKSYFKF